MESDRVGWPAFLDRFDWKQGEHVSLIGTTGGGKTTLARAILDRRQYVTVLATKPADSTLDKLRGDGYVLARRWPPPIPRRARYTNRGVLAEHRVLLWPKYRGESDLPTQEAVFRPAVDAMFRRGGWTLFFDEVRYFTDQLRMRKSLELLWLQARSTKVTIVAATQRPAHVPLEMYSQATHLFFWRDNDEANLKRIGGMGGLSAKAIREAVAALPKHDVLYVNTRTGDTAHTRVERT